MLKTKEHTQVHLLNTLHTLDYEHLPASVAQACREVLNELEDLADSEAVANVVALLNRTKGPKSVNRQGLTALGLDRLSAELAFHQLVDSGAVQTTPLATPLEGSGNLEELLREQDAKGLSPLFVRHKGGELRVPRLEQTLVQERVLEAVMGGNKTTGKIYQALGLHPKTEKEPLLKILRELVKGGEIRREGFRYFGNAGG